MREVKRLVLLPSRAMNREKIFKLIQKKQSMLCVGLDTDLRLIPARFLSMADPVFEFNKAVIDATKEVAVAYKPNLAFYESMGTKGWTSLERTMEYLSAMGEEVFTIADAKRGDIGNTSKMYAKTFFELLNFDAVTVAPYMGEDSVTPFLDYTDRWLILLGLTSNRGSSDFQMLDCGGKKLYEQVIEKAQQWADARRLMFVVGATHPDELKHIRSLAPDYFFLVPGVGAQGGDVNSICRNGMNAQGGLLINSSRGIIYPSGNEDFEPGVRKAATELKVQMEPFVRSLGHS